MTVLLLDVMDTLVSDPFFTHLPSFFGAPLDELAPQMSFEVWCAFERGEIDERAYHRGAFKDNRAFDLKAMKKNMLEGYTFFEGIEPLLQEIQARGVPMFALSNYPIWYKHIEEKLSLSRFMSWSTVSCETGYRKPGRECYEKAAKIAGVPMNECIFVDDRQSNTSAAEALGIRSILMPAERSKKKADHLRSTLLTLGVL